MSGMSEERAVVAAVDPAVGPDMPPEPPVGDPPPRRRRLKLSAGVIASGIFVAIAILITITVPILPLKDPNAQDLMNSLGPMSGSSWLGTDDLGRDLFSRLMWGIHTSMIAALIAVVVAVVLGLPTGLIAGFTGGWLDQILSRFSDVILTVPALILLLAAQTALNTGIRGQMIVLGLIFAPRIMRVVRAETVRLAASPFVTAGAMSGCSNSRLIFRYLLPGVRPQLAVQTSYLLGLSLVVEAGISFLGIGVKPPESSLGSLLIGASGLLSTEPRVILIPALVLTLLILALNVLGDALTKEARS